jgi:hypothetical protein
MSSSRNDFGMMTRRRSGRAPSASPNWGHDPPEVLHMLMFVLSGGLLEAMHWVAPKPQEAERTRAALAALPGTWQAK